MRPISVSIRKLPNGRYEARWREPGEKNQRQRRFARKIDAEKFKASLITSRLTGSADPDVDSVLFGTFAETWVAGLTLAPSSRGLYAFVVEEYLIPKFGSRPLSSIRKSDLQAFVAELHAKPLSAKTTYGYFAVLKQILRAAFDDGLIRTQPWNRVALPRDDREGVRVDPPTVGEFHALADAIDARWRALVWVIAGTGLRPGEAAGLTLDRIDFDAGYVRVDRQLDLVSGRGLVRAKTTSSYRRVPLPESVASELLLHLATFGPGPLGTGPAVDPKAPASPLVFSNEPDVMPSRGIIRHAFRRAGVKIGKPVNPHLLRHFYATGLIQSGASVKTVQKNLGHATAKETLDTYAHFWPDSDTVTRGAMDALLTAGRATDPADLSRHAAGNEGLLRDPGNPEA